MLELYRLTTTGHADPPANPPPSFASNPSSTLLAHTHTKTQQFKTQSATPSNLPDNPPPNTPAGSQSNPADDLQEYPPTPPCTDTETTPTITTGESYTPPRSPPLITRKLEKLSKSDDLFAGSPAMACLKYFSGDMAKKILAMEKEMREYKTKCAELVKYV